MSEPTTPYDPEIEALETKQRHSRTPNVAGYYEDRLAVVRAKREGYLRALADAPAWDERKVLSVVETAIIGYEMYSVNPDPSWWKPIAKSIAAAIIRAQEASRGE